MGMAASQARYLALVARKSNCEYEGQQINQARTVLSNQTANLFNQMLGLSVPVPPSTQDFTKVQYSFTDGVNGSTIDSWEQLASPESDYNYVVTHHYYADVYTGSQKMMNDPQVQYTSGTPATVAQLETALKLITETKAAYEEAKAATAEKKEEAATLSNYADNTSYSSVYKVDQKITSTENQYSVYQKMVETTTIGTDSCEVYMDPDTKTKYAKNGDNYYAAAAAGGWEADAYTGDTSKFVKSMVEDPTEYLFVNYNNLDDTIKPTVEATIATLIENGALDEDVTKDYASIYYDATNNSIALKTDLIAAKNGETQMPVYNTAAAADPDSVAEIAAKYESEIAMLENLEYAALQAYESAETAYENLERPTYIGNCQLTLLTELTSDQEAEIRQIITDMKAQDVDASINDCMDTQGNYLGGVYQFTLNGITYYTTFEDLNDSYASGSGINHIDGQDRLAYYNASYVSTKIEETEKALLETDSQGRFTSVRFENDTIKYTLNMETITDDVAYQDAMNQYYYESAKYDKTVQDINAKTSLIQQEDQQLELRLKQLDTEQNALSTEIDAVSKIVKDNVEKSFKTFGG